MVAKRIIFVLTVAVAAAMAVLIVGSFLPGIWICDLGSQFRLVYVVLILILFIVALTLKSNALTLFTAILFLTNGAPIAQMLLHRNVAASSNIQQISMLSYNTEFQHNNHYELFEALVRERNPDIVTLVEVDDKWIDALAETMKAYKYRKIVLAGAGLALYSKMPLEDTTIWSFGKSHHPRISTTVRVGDQKLNLLVIHPTTPQSEAGFEERDRELNVVRNEMAAMAGAKVLVGDFNDGPWSNAFRRLMDSGLQDSEQGYGPQPSWPARVGRVFPNIDIPPLIPIDHFLVSESVIVKTRVAGPALQSDHLPIFVQLAINQ